MSTVCVAQRPIGKEEQTKKGGLTLEELEAQVGGLLPNRTEMHHHHGGGGSFSSSCGGLVVALGCGSGVGVVL